MTRVFLVFVFAWSAGLPQSWIQTLDGGAGENDIIRALILDDTGNAIVTGVMEGGANSVAGTAKFGLDGRLRFLAVYDPYPGFDQMGYDVSRDSSGCIYVAAPSRDMDTVWCFATICYGPDGAERWVARYSRPEHYSDLPYAVAAFASGGCVVTGRGGGNSSVTDMVTVCYSRDSFQRWVSWRNGGADENDHALAVAVDGQGCGYVCGYTTEPSSFQRERATIIKYDTLGNEIWSYTFKPVGPNDHSAWYDIAIDPIGSVYLTGYVVVPGTGLAVKPCVS